MNSENDLAEQVSIRENKLTLVERLADDLAHEIKNPLHSMVINLEVLRRRIARLDNGSNQELLRYAGILSSELERVNQRVDLLLRMVRPARDSAEPSTLPEVLEELRDLVQLECERHGVQLTMETPSGFGRGSFHPPSMRQLILSLILQSLESLPAGGSLTVSTELDTDSMRIHFHPRLPDTARLAPGAGEEEDGALLSVARVLAEQLGGEVTVVSPDSSARAAPEPQPDRYLLTLPRGD